jgi:surface protein
MFWDCSSLKTANLSGWNLSNVTNIGYLFSGCSSIESVNLSGWNQPNSLSSYKDIATGSSLKNVNLSNSTLYSISLVGNIAQYAKTSIEHIDLSGTTVSDAASSSFCNGCTNLKTIDFTGFTYPAAPPRYQNWFNNCSQLESLGDIVFDFTSISSASSVGKMFYGCTTLGENQVTLKFKNVKQSVFTDEATLRTKAVIPEGCVVQIQNWI